VKTALITTTINVPRVLKLYRKLASPEMRFFVAMDEKTPPHGTWELNDGFCLCMTPAYQKAMNCESSELIGWNTDSRRNMALLEALKWGADLIVSIDDDMIPTQSEFVPEDIFEFGFSGLQLGQAKSWFDAGGYTHEQAKQRGLPLQANPVSPPDFVAGAKIGVAQGIILGTPDTDACTAISEAPFVHSTTDILHNGFVVHPKAYAVFNSQFTCFRRELAPAFAQYYFAQGRNTDIMASMLMRRIMQERNLYTYYGPPMAFHARTPRPLFNDLNAEMYGLEHIAEYADYLRRAPLPDGSVVDQCRVLSEGWNGPELQAAKAWYNDVEKVL